VGNSYERVCRPGAACDKVPEPNEEVDEFVAISRSVLVEKVKTKPDEYIPSFLDEIERAVIAYEELSK